mmetsp:Transcript_4829/g.10219  ORF Transcript_4829/g.10219 Transcript_4829/m.10219 type:complete len:209 (-) Transcript_4829:52-678(-)
MLFHVVLLAAVTVCSTYAYDTEPFKVKFEVDYPAEHPHNGSFTVEVYPEWAPLAAARFKEAVEANIWHDSRFFRVIPGNMATFGFPVYSKTIAEWDAKKIKDEPVLESNKRGTLSFYTKVADGPDSRTFVVSINLADNPVIDDKPGGAPFARVVKGWSDVRRLHVEKGGPNEERMRKEGVNYLKGNYPRLSYIRRVYLLDGETTGDEL